MIVQSLFFCIVLLTWLIHRQDNNYKILSSFVLPLLASDKRIIDTHREYTSTKVDTLLAVKSGAHAYAAKRYSKGRIKANYDKHWEALGGTEFDRHYYTLSLEDIRRNPEDISRPKRAMYRRRYEWLDTVNETLQQKISLEWLI